SACKRNDRKAQKYLFEVNAPVMLAVCRRYIRDKDVAESTMLEGFMKAFHKIDQFRFEGPLQGWVRRIMVTTCLEWIRKNKMMYKEVDIEDVQIELDYQELGDRLEAEDLMQMIAELPQG